MKNPFSAYASDKVILPPSEAKTLGDRFKRIRAAYAHHQVLVDRGVASWGLGEDPYSVADWTMMFTPIESAAWGDIRAMGIPLWPQLPVGKYFVDFGNPVIRVALECDGAEWHQNVKKDRNRDTVLESMGWTVYRAPGWQCNVDFDRPEDWADMSEQDKFNWRWGVESQSLKPILMEIKRRCELSGILNRGARR